MGNSEVFIPQTNGEISETLFQNWTEQAWECYCNNFNCNKCSIHISQYSFVCQMPKVVEALKLLYGDPE